MGLMLLRLAPAASAVCNRVAVDWGSAQAVAIRCFKSCGTDSACGDAVVSLIQQVLPDVKA